jgi:protein-L-isoaspartate(D-aspartate) O-methyltransferase
MAVPRWQLPKVPSVSGVGLTSGRAHQAMVAGLRQQGIRDERVLTAMASVVRHNFVQAGFASRAYEDVALPIGHEQTISKPSTVARMIELGLERQQKPLQQLRALEVGTGCGYQAAVMASLFGSVVSIERIRGLHELAAENIRTLRWPHLRLMFGDGLLGYPAGAPYDFIVIAAAGLAIPDDLLMQMRIGSRLVAPVSDADGSQALHVMERTSEKDWQLTKMDSARFVPLLSGTR